MVHKLNPKEVVDNWKFISQQLKKFFKVTEVEEKYLFNKILIGLSHVWVLYSTDKEKKPLCIAVTSFQRKVGREEPCLYIIYLLSVSPVVITKEQWASSFEDLKKFALDNKCTKIIGSTNLPYVYNLFKSIADVEEYIIMEVNINGNQ